MQICIRLPECNTDRIRQFLKNILILFSKLTIVTYSFLGINVNLFGLNVYFNIHLNKPQSMAQNKYVNFLKKSKRNTINHLPDIIVGIRNFSF